MQRPDSGKEQRALEKLKKAGWQALRGLGKEGEEKKTDWSAEPRSQRSFKITSQFLVIS